MKRALFAVCSLLLGSVVGVGIVVRAGYVAAQAPAVVIAPAEPGPGPEISLSATCHPPAWMRIDAIAEASAEPFYVHRYWTSANGVEDYDLVSVRRLSDGRIEVAIGWDVKPQWTWWGRLDEKSLPPEGLLTQQETCK